jgi:hypothetical protein
MTMIRGGITLTHMEELGNAEAEIVTAKYSEKRPKRWQCIHCGHTYVYLGKWLFKHFEKQHPNMPMKCKDLQELKFR